MWLQKLRESLTAVTASPHTHPKSKVTWEKASVIDWQEFRYSPQFAFAFENFSSFRPPLMHKTKSLVEKCFLGPSPSFSARTKGQADVDTLEQFALHADTVPDNSFVLG